MLLMELHSTAYASTGWSANTAASCICISSSCVLGQRFVDIALSVVATCGLTHPVDCRSRNLLACTRIACHTTPCFADSQNVGVTSQVEDPISGLPVPLKFLTPAWHGLRIMYHVDNLYFNE